jgi:predicted dehydrogenase
MNDNRIRWGVIGSGGIARRRTIPEGIIPAENALLLAVFDIDPQANEEVAHEYGTQAAGSIKELLEYGIDAVYVASPANLHLEHVIACAGAGKHVLCEKPLGMNVEEAGKMISACNNAGVVLGTALMMRFHAQHQAALKMVIEGKIGKPVFGRAQLSCWYPPIDGAWRQDPLTGGGGSLMDMGSHCIDLLEMFFGKIDTVSCFISNNIHHYKSEDSALVSMKFESGALATVDTFFCIPDNSSKNVLEIYGSRGSILAKGTIGQGDSGEMVAYLEGDDAGYDAQQSREESDAISIDPLPMNTYLAEIIEFSDALLENRAPANGSAIGLQSQKVLAACYRSAASGMAEKVNQYPL